MSSPWTLVEEARASRTMRVRVDSRDSGSIRCRWICDGCGKVVSSRTILVSTDFDEARRLSHVDADVARAHVCRPRRRALLSALRRAEERLFAGRIMRSVHRRAGARGPWA